MNIKAYI